MVKVFGPAWSRGMCDVARELNVPLEWPLAKIALESGFDPLARNASGARGLWQAMPKDMGEHDGQSTLPPGWYLRTVMRDGKTTVRMMKPYLTTDPVVQLREGLAFWKAMARDFHVGAFRSRASLYCLNIAPARLRDGAYDDETILYSADPADKAHAYYWPTAYRQNAASFGLNPADPVGKLRMKHLDVGLDAAIARHRARYDAELEAAAIANVAPP